MSAASNNQNIFIHVLIYDNEHINSCWLLRGRKDSDDTNNSILFLDRQLPPSRGQNKIGHCKEVAAMETFIVLSLRVWLRGSGTLQNISSLLNTSNYNCNEINLRKKQASIVIAALI